MTTAHPPPHTTHPAALQTPPQTPPIDRAPTPAATRNATPGIEARILANPFRDNPWNTLSTPLWAKPPGSPFPLTVT